MKKLLFALVVLCCIFSSCEKAGGDLKKVDDVCLKMDDINFMRYCYEKFDVNGDGKVSLDEANAAKSVNCHSSAIYSLKGIEYFPNIVYLDCSSNRLTSLDISNNLLLTDLSCNYNQLTTLDISNNTKLTMVSAGNQQSTITIYVNDEQYKLRSKFMTSAYSKNIVWKIK